MFSVVYNTIFFYDSRLKLLLCQKNVLSLHRQNDKKDTKVNEVCLCGMLKCILKNHNIE